MITHPFYSKSARLATAAKAAPKKVTEIKIRRAERPYLFWIGKDVEGCFAECKRFGFVCERYAYGDLSRLLHANGVIVKDVGLNFHRDLNVCTFAKDYGVPLIWRHKYMMPGRWQSLFDLFCVGCNSNDFWRELCQLCV